MLWEKWKKEIMPQLKKELKIENCFALPKVVKVVVHMGVADERNEAEAINRFAEELALITGQKAKICRAKKSISAFKLRRGEVVGLQVTLRGKKMYDFLEKLFCLVLPRLRDFRGLPEEKFDKEGNYSLGIPEQTVFPEIPVSKVKQVKGIGVTIATQAKDRHQAKILLASLGLPFVAQG